MSLRSETPYKDIGETSFNRLLGGLDSYLF